MTYIENVFVCIAAPLLVAALCAGRKHLRFFLFMLAGMLSCLLCLRWEPARADRLCLWVSRCTAALVLLGGLMGLRAGLGPGPLLISAALFLRAMGLLPL